MKNFARYSEECIIFAPVKERSLNFLTRIFHIKPVKVFGEDFLQDMTAIFAGMLCPVAGSRQREEEKNEVFLIK
ncbi:MAG: hypothetical protein LBM08_03450 [Dysgonamonadaceae bacterium]|nr:hypothetical protein [Dysgonamonadaceae bacterium]